MPTKKVNANKRIDQLFQRLDKFIPAYKILKTYVNPFRGRFHNDDSDVGKIIDHKTLIRSHATHSVNIFAAGLNNGMTNKSNQWFKLTLEDQMMLEIEGVRGWLDDVAMSMYSVINKSNLYNAFYSCYQELGTFGTGCYIINVWQDDITSSSKCS